MLANQRLKNQGLSIQTVILASRRGLTLLELLVVLVILTIVATVAVNSLRPRVETQRFDQTRTLLGNIQESIVGSRLSRQTDGTPLISGFVADVGRFPRPDSNLLNNGQGLELAELWSDEAELARVYPFQFRQGPSTPVDYSHIQIPCGWRGPYLQLPFGTDTVEDAWSRPLEFEFTSDGTIDCIVWEPIGDFDQELNCNLKTGKVIVSGTLNFGQSEPTQVEVVLLVPAPDSSLSELVVIADEDEQPGTFAFSDVPIGLRAICVRYEQNMTTRYIHVPQQGLTMSIDLSTSNPIQNPDPDSNEN